MILCDTFLKIVLIAEVTQPSLGVGYEIGRALDMNKKILCLFRPDSGRRNGSSSVRVNSVHLFFLSCRSICNVKRS